MKEGGAVYKLIWYTYAHAHIATHHIIHWRTRINCRGHTFQILGREKWHLFFKPVCYRNSFVSHWLNVSRAELQVRHEHCRSGNYSSFV